MNDSQKLRKIIEEMVKIELIEEAGKIAAIQDFIKQNSSLSLKELKALAEKKGYNPNTVATQRSRMNLGSSTPTKTEPVKATTGKTKTTEPVKKEPIKAAPVKTETPKPRSSAKKVAPTSQDASSAIRSAGLRVDNLWDDIEISKDGKLRFGIDVDRGPRTDHGGGEDGEGWMSSSEIRSLKNDMQRAHGKKMESLKKSLTEKGFTNVQINDDYGEKGHYTFEVQADSIPMTAKQRETTQRKEAREIVKAEKAKPKERKPSQKLTEARAKLEGLQKIDNELSNDYERLVNRLGNYKRDFLSSIKQTPSMTSAKKQEKLEKDATYKRLQKQVREVSKAIDALAPKLTKARAAVRSANPTPKQSTAPVVKKVETAAEVNAREERARIQRAKDDESAQLRKAAEMYRERARWRK